MSPSTIEKSDIYRDTDELPVKNSPKVKAKAIKHVPRETRNKEELAKTLIENYNMTSMDNRPSPSWDEHTKGKYFTKHD